MINYESIIRDYKKVVAESKEKDKEIERLKNSKTEKNDITKALLKISELESNLNDAQVKYNALKRDYSNLLDANVKLADIIKEYNPEHFGKYEGRHDIPDKEDWW